MKVLGKRNLSAALINLSAQLQVDEPLVLAGNTASGVYHEWPQSQVIVDIKNVKEMRHVRHTPVRTPSLNKNALIGYHKLGMM